MEQSIVDATSELMPDFDWTAFPGAFGVRCRQAAIKALAQLDPPFGGFGRGRRHLLFVGLPVALYVSDCPHLYHLVRRLRSLSSLERPATPDVIRDVLDAERLPYSVLAYALVAAMQVLHIARLPGGRGASGLELLAPKGGALIFRGLWVSTSIDEHLASHSWSFNSFSRSVDGVLSVLNFYSSASGSEAARLAAEDAHVLLLVARFRDGGAQWVFPVQLFAGGECSFPANVEQEVMVPPFARYFFEPGGEISSRLPENERRDKLCEVLQRWDLDMVQEAPPLLALLAGAGQPSTTLKALSVAPHVTMRFVSRIEPALPMRDLLGAVEQVVPTEQSRSRCLMHFPKVKERTLACTRDWKDMLLALNGKPQSRGGWSSEDWPQLKLWIVGTWSSWEPQRMKWHNGAFVCPVVIGSNGWESFQLLVNGSWSAVIYPSAIDASVWGKGWTVCGPDEHSHGKNWQIGKVRVEKTTPGSRFMVIVCLNRAGAVASVRWRTF
mmetsp:Transcript_52568/g.169622  ORF Transcript_52568/g.169622 Transcript_52568/m.169622 type:complete len:496 (-) Transcript_52568:25-1512(-)